MREVEKEKILLANGYHLTNGYILEYEKPDNADCQNIVISREEVEKFMKEVPTKYFWNENTEWYETLDEAFDSFFDNYLCDNDVAYSDSEDDFINIMLLKIEGNSPNQSKL